MDCTLSKDHELLEDFPGDFDMLLSDENFESKSTFDSLFLDSLIDNADTTHWPEVFPQLSDLDTFDDDVEIKTEMSSLADSPQSISFSDTSSNSSEDKFTLETPPVSPPREELSPCNVPLQKVTQKKSTILKINPNNIKIIRNVKGIRPIGKQTQIVLSKEVLQKVMKCKSENGGTKKSIPSIQSNITLGTPIILPSSRLHTNGIPLCTAETPSIKVEPLNQPIAPTPYIKRESLDVSLKNDLNLKALKRQQRMIKNRESACLSRKKKKEYVTTLETRVSELEKENSQLKLENGRLRDRVKELENTQDYRMPNKFLSNNLKKTSAVLAVLVMVSLNLAPLGFPSRENGGELSSPPISFPDVGSKHSGGRALLWAQPDVEEIADNFTVPDKSICPLHINQTESLRLEKELRRWIEIGENKSRNNTKNFQGLKPPLKVQPNAYSPYRLKALKKSYRLQKGGTSAVAFYRPPFPGSLPRRDDTFYVFSFSSDHLLVPAVAHDKTLRPKMSFLIPTVSLNDSMLTNGSVPMMQVDCEVLATKSVELTEEDFRTFRPKQEATVKNSTSTNGQSKDLKYRPYFIGDTKPASQADLNFDRYLKHVYRTVNSFP